MSGLEIAAGVIGISDFALRSIKSLYDFFQDLQDARENLPQIWNEVSYLQKNLSGLDFLSKADEDTLKEVRVTGITQGMNDCGSACDKFIRQLTRWTEKGVDSFAGKLKFKLHSAQIEKNRTRLWTTARMLDMTVGILTLKLVNKSATERAVEMSALKQAVVDWKREAEQKRERISVGLKAIDESKDSGVLDELDEEESVLKSFVKQSDQTVEQLQAVGLKQSITRIKVDEEAVASLGMPATVVDKVSEQTISDVDIGKKSNVKIGIWEGKIEIE